MKQAKTTFIAAVVIAILLAPLAYVFYWTLRAGELSTTDYWGIVPIFYSVQGFSSNPWDWLVRSNEHFIIIPSIIYAINILTTRGSNIGLSLVTIIFASAQLLLLTALLPDKLKRSRPVYLLLLLCISIFSFTPAAAHTWMRGYSGVAWVGSNMFVIAAIFCLKQLAIDQKLKWAIASIVFGISGYFTYSSSLALWPILCAAAVLLKLQRRLILLFFGSASLIGTIFWLTYRTPDYHPSLTSLDPRAAVAYFPVYLGAIFTFNTNLALGFGVIGLITVAGLVNYWLRLSPSPVKTAWMPWLAIQIYVVINAFLTSISRSAYGLEQARETRYASLPSLFWLSLIVVIVLWLQQTHPNLQQRWRLLTPVFAVITALVVSMYHVGTAAAQYIADATAFHPLVSLSVQLGVSDTDLLIYTVTPVPEQFLNFTEALKVHNLVPFNRDIRQENFCTTLDQEIDSSLLISAAPDKVPGFFDQTINLTTGVAKVEGRISDRSGIVKCIAILNQDHIVRGFAMTGFQNPTTATPSNSSAEFTTWMGYVQILPTDQQLTAYAVLKQRPEWIALPDSFEL